MSYPDNGGGDDDDDDDAYPSPKSTLTLTSHLGQNVELGEG